jgi:predicted dithiol-disulfide oxidoreductase (DUF899 family)
MSTKSPANDVQHHPVASQEEWLAARKALLVKEKEFTRLRDEPSQDRRRLPWERVGKNYVFEGTNGRRTRRSFCFLPSTRCLPFHVCPRMG